MTIYVDLLRALKGRTICSFRFSRERGLNFCVRSTALREIQTDSDTDRETERRARSENANVWRWHLHVNLDPRQQRHRLVQVQRLYQRDQRTKAVLVCFLFRKCHFFKFRLTFDIAHTDLRHFTADYRRDENELSAGFSSSSARRNKGYIFS